MDGSSKYITRALNVAPPKQVKEKYGCADQAGTAFSEMVMFADYSNDESKQEASLLNGQLTNLARCMSYFDYALAVELSAFDTVSTKERNLALMKEARS